MGAIIPLTGALSVFLVVFSIYLLVQTLRDAETEELPRSNVITDSPFASLIYRMGRINNRPGLSSFIDSTDRKLVLAGNPGRGITGLQYLVAVELLSITISLVFLSLFLISGSSVLGALVFSTLVGLAVFWLSFEWLKNLITTRRVNISRQFPYFLDLMVMTQEAGTSFLEAVDIYIRDTPPNTLVEELRMTLGEINMGKTFDEAMKNFETRITAEEVQNTIRALIQGSRMGTPLGNVLRDQADATRFKRSQLAERAAEEIKVKLQGPAMLLMLSVLLLILGPAMIEMFTSGALN